MPVVRLVFLFTAHVQQNCTVLYCSTVQICKYNKNDDHHEPRTNEIPFNIKEGRSAGGRRQEASTVQYVLMHQEDRKK
jgi:hypothetical protein